ncbi:CYTH domain-containing protein [Microbacterium sp. RU33B]|uniref:CYTH domain-containing protein n=1 Tax=Microbacterium sp. RU33B TaxID=1907390 RepID=UPI00095DFA09|nr:CYTH domain-containing protein [Microbacterium sp. RU33B]SIT76983.1 CYTH domain-containing protein [Microbacterium sp. RU33B]
MAAPEPSRSREIELTFDVRADTPLPDWSGLPGVVAVSAPEVRELDARYLDADDLALGRAGFALRRRTGGPDAGWHIKGPRGEDGGRTELHWPLGDDDDDDVPEGARAVLRAVTGAPLSPLARIRNSRTAYALRDADGGVVAEFVDDRVAATDERRGVETVWREWEFELGAAAPGDADARASLFAAAEAAVFAVGGRVAASDSKLARTLGL